MGEVVSYTVKPDPERMREVFASLPQRIKDRVLRGFGQWLNRVAARARKKVNGEVLQRRSGRLYKSLGIEYNMAAATGTVYETAYGALWEHTGHGVIRPINGCQCPICRRSTTKFLHFFSEATQRWVRTTSVAAVPPKPHILPAIEELADLRRKLVTEPLARVLAAAFKAEKGE